MASLKSSVQEVELEKSRHAMRSTLVGLFVAFAALLLFIYFFKAFKYVILGILASACIASALKPLARHVPGQRWTGAVVAGMVPVALFAGVVGLVYWMVSTRLRDSVSSWPEIEQRMNDVLTSVSNQFGLADPITVDRIGSYVRESLSAMGDGQIAGNVTDALTGLLIAGTFIFFGTVYLMGEKPGRMWKPLLPLLPPSRRAEGARAFEDLEPRLRWWVIGTIFSMSIVAGVSWAGYAVIGLDMALALAIFGGVAQIVPTIGPAVAFIVAELFASTQGSYQMIGVAVVYLGIQLIESNFLLPVVMKQSLHIPPFVTLFTLIFWGLVFGLPGFLLAVPLDVTVWTFYEHLVLRPRKAEHGDVEVTGTSE